MPTNPAHTLQAIRAVLNVIETHQLAMPREIHAPGHLLSTPAFDNTPNPTIGVDLGRVTLEEFAKWEEITGLTYDSVPVPGTLGSQYDYIRHSLTGNLQPYGIAVTVVGRTPDNTTSAAPSLTVVE